MYIIRIWYYNIAPLNIESYLISNNAIAIWCYINNSKHFVEKRESYRFCFKSSKRFINFQIKTRLMDWIKNMILFLYFIIPVLSFPIVAYNLCVFWNMFFAYNMSIIKAIFYRKNTKKNVILFYIFTIA